MLPIGMHMIQKSTVRDTLSSVEHCGLSVTSQQRPLNLVVDCQYTWTRFIQNARNMCQDAGQANLGPFLQ